MSDTPRVDELDGLVSLIESDNQIVNNPARWEQHQLPTGLLHCRACGELRRVSVRCMHVEFAQLHSSLGPLPAFLLNRQIPTLLQIVTALFEYRCTQCEGRFTALLAPSADGPILIVLPGSWGSAPSDCPVQVAFYLEQANKAQAVGAFVASVAMYRAALEALLLDQGFKHRMLGPKIKALQAAIEAGEAPLWATQLDLDFLDAIKELGNAAIHAGEDPAEYETLDSHFCHKMDGLFQMLVYIVYKQSAQQRSLLESFRAKQRAFGR